VGGSSYYGAYQGALTSRTVSGLPTDGSTVYVRLMSYISGSWVTNDYTYTAANTSPPPPPNSPSVMTSPTPGTTLAGASVTFNWSAGSGVAERFFAVGTAMGASDIYGAYQGSATSHTVTNLPTNGSTVYVRLMSYIAGMWVINDYTYTASGAGGGGGPPAKSNITSPAPGSMLSGSSITFTWDAGSGITERYLMVGTTMGGSNIYAAYQGAAMSHMVTGVPTNGSTLYVRLMSYISGAWQQNDYTYTTGP
jgi:hypothetical protein